MLNFGHDDDDDLMFYVPFNIIQCLVFWVKFSADYILEYFSYFFPENRYCYFMLIISIGDNLHKMSNPVFWEK